MTEIEATINLIACALHQKKPNPADVPDLEGLLRFAVRQSVAALLGSLLTDNGLLSGSDREEWSELFFKNLRKTLAFDAERKRLEAALDDAHIRHAPLKGIILNRLYPVYGMREFADNDILVDDGRQTDLRRIMADLGYQPTSFSQEVDLSFHKEPFFNFELHHRLFADKKRLTALNDYYSDVHAKLILAGGSAYAYRFSDEDFYIYICAHAYKHYTGSGIGVRQLIDIYLCRQNYPTDTAYVAHELQALGILSFVRQLESLADKLFSQEQPFTAASLTAEEQPLFAHSVGHSVYGSIDQYYTSQITDYLDAKGGGKQRYCLHRLFPDIEDYKDRHPVFYRHKVLRPLFYVYRPFYSLFTNRSKLTKELRMVAKYHSKKEK